MARAGARAAHRQGFDACGAKRGVLGREVGSVADPDQKSRFEVGRPKAARATLRDRMNDCGFELATIEGMICEDCAYRDPDPTTVGLCSACPGFKPDEVDEGICPRYKKE